MLNKFTLILFFVNATDFRAQIVNDSVTVAHRTLVNRILSAFVDVVVAGISSAICLFMTCGFPTSTGDCHCLGVASDYDIIRLVLFSVQLLCLK